MQLIGIDPFASAELDAGGAQGAAPLALHEPQEARRWFTEPGRCS